MMHISQVEAQALAAFVSRIRPDWDHPGILAAIAKARSLGSAADIGSALCKLAANPGLRTPALLSEPGAHWAGAVTGTRQRPDMCPEHPAEKAGACQPCEAQAVCDAEKLAALAAGVRAAMLPRPHPVPQRDPMPRDLAAVRARADKETQR